MKILQEQFMALYFNRTNKLIGWRLLSTGSIKPVVVDVKLLVSICLECMASCVLVAHNHPSGNIQPSKHDVDITHQIKCALKLIDVKLLDHLIIAAGGYLSFSDEGIF